jgi:phage tail sheath protein FI
MAAPMKTPGVYIVEKNAFPNSVVEVATAVPAFIGYTERADNQGRSLLNTPWRISSMSEFITYYGVAPSPKFEIRSAAAVAATATWTPAAAIADGETVKVGTTTYTFKTALSTPAAPGEILIGADEPTALTNLATVINAAAKPNPDVKATATATTLTLTARKSGKAGDTIAVAASAGAWTPSGATTLNGGKDSLETDFVVTANAAERTWAAAKSAALSLTATATPADGDTLKVGAATYTFKTALSNPAAPGEVLIGADLPTALTNLAAKINDAAAPNPDVAATATAADLTLTAKSLGVAGNKIAVATIGAWTPALAATLAGGGDAAWIPAVPTITPYHLDALADGKFNLYYAMELFFQNLGGPCYIVSVGPYEDADGNPTPIDLDKLSQGIDTLELEQEPTMVVIPDAVLLARSDCYSLQQHMLQHCGYTMKNRFAILDIWDGFRRRQEELSDNSGVDCISSFRDSLGINQLDYGAAYYPWVRTTIVESNAIDFTNLIDTDGATLLSMLRTEMGLAGTPTAAVDATTPKPIRDFISILNYVDGQRNPPAKADQAWPGAQPPPTALQLNESLLRTSQGYADLIAAVTRKLNLMPPSAAMAGLYTMVDNVRGVWKAPANVSVTSAVEPAVNITAADQEDLNVTPMGKSINAIRSFKGEGTLVWGARTLNGNSLDWRYINVRRTMIMLEESCKLAAKAMVFEPNVADTWVTIRSMIENFLTSVWKRGGLAGAVPADAFSVHVGLGDTMTADDILEGILRVTVLVAISHPAEFIEITFQQQMQKS